MSKVMLMGLIDKAKDEIVNKYADDIPFVSEEKEQLFFEKIVDLVTDIVEGIVKK